MNKAVMFSSLRGDWKTPKELMGELEKEFHFDRDITPPKHSVDELDPNPWTGVVYGNPPYGRGIGDWTAKGLKSCGGGAIVVMLLPARTDTKWFHRDILGQAEIRFIKGRLHFDGHKNGAPFQSMIVIWRATTKK